MARDESRLTQKGQITIPAAIRRQLGLKPGENVRFEVENDAVKITRVTSRILDGYGALTPRNHPEHFDALREEFESGVAEEAQGEGRELSTGQIGH